MDIWKDIVRNVAPTIGAALGGPFGGMAAKYLSGKLLGDENASEADLANAIVGANPEQLIQIKNIDKEFKLQMKSLDVDLEKLANEDRGGARDLFKVNIWPQIVLSGIFVVGYFSIIGTLIFFYDIEFNDKIFGALVTVLGVLTSGIASIMQFWFGSSAGSKEKDKQRPPPVAGN